MPREIRQLWQRLKHSLGHSPDRDKNDYATHLPTLLALSKLLHPRFVIEFGCGRYSTCAFLDRVGFPDLVHLESFEGDRRWLEEVAELTKCDSRLVLSLPPTDVAGYLRIERCKRADLVLIDDGTTPNERLGTMRAVLSAGAPMGVVVIHDFEVTLYQEAVPPGFNTFIFKAFLPWTGVVWAGDRLTRADMKPLDRRMRSVTNCPSVADTRAWAEVFGLVNA